MKKRRVKRDYKSVLLHLFLLLIFILFNNVESEYSVFSVAIFAVAISLGSSLFITPILFLLSFIVLGKMGMLASMAISVGVLLIVLFIYKGFENTPKYEMPALIVLALVGYALLGDTVLHTELKSRIIVSVIVAVFSIFAFIGGRAVKEKGLKVKLDFIEYLSLVVSVTALGLGTCNFTTPLVWKALSVIIILISAYTFKTGMTTIISASLGISVAVYYGDISFIAIYLLFGLISEGITHFSRYLSAIAVVVSEYLIQLLFTAYGSYNLVDFAVILGAGIIFCIIPTKFLLRLKEKMYSFREKQLERQAINRNRLMVSSRLFEISTVFSEMANAFYAFRENAPSESDVKNAIEREVRKSVCADCKNREKCRQTIFLSSSPFIPLISVGIAKGRVSFIDIPKELDFCIKPNDIAYCINKLLIEYKNSTLSSSRLSAGRELIAEQALGVSETLRSLAIECGSLLKYQSRTERKLTDKLLKSGLPVSELLIYGDGENSVVSVITDMKEIPVESFEKVISEVFGFSLTLTEKAVVTDEKLFLSFSKSAEYDAVFGLAHTKKNGSTISGDTHSVTRIPNDKFLIALSDGMGSGKNAEKVSATSLTLIESFYKAGLSSPLILKTVNKLLSVNTEDTFTALDVSVIDLKTLSADFIKYGSPYGFIVGRDGIKIVEGNSLPLGILEELKPAVCHTSLDDGDMLILLTDGVSDAFGSSSGVIDYLRSVPNKNPQTLADGILERAIRLSGGEKRDDMTALTVRVFKKDA